MKNKEIRRAVTAAFVITGMMISSGSLHAAQKQYEVVFKAALHGTFNKSSLDSRCVLENSKEAVCLINAGASFPKAPEVSVDSGYRLKSDFYRAPAEKVEERTVVVAKYSRLINGLEYLIRYVDERGNDLTTPIIRTTEKGMEETAYAKIIEGYQTDAESKTMRIDKDKAEIIFYYTSTAEAVVRVEETTRTEEIITNTEILTTDMVNSQPEAAPVTVNNPVPEVNQNNASNENSTPNENNTTNENDPDTPLTNGKENNKDNGTDVENNETPKAGETSGLRNALPYVAGGIGILAVLFAAFWFMKKKKINEQE